MHSDAAHTVCARLLTTIVCDSVPVGALDSHAQTSESLPMCFGHWCRPTQTKRGLGSTRHWLLCRSSRHPFQTRICKPCSPNCSSMCHCAMPTRPCIDMLLTRMQTSGWTWRCRRSTKSECQKTLQDLAVAVRNLGAYGSASN
jgi:hypothetical protein